MLDDPSISDDRLRAELARRGLVAIAKPLATSLVEDAGGRVVDDSDPLSVVVENRTRPMGARHAIRGQGRETR